MQSRVPTLRYVNFAAGKHFLGILRTTTTVLLLVLASGCITAGLSRPEAVDLARQYAVSKGFKASDYHVTCVEEDSEEIGVCFDANRAETGNHFIIYVNKSNRGFRLDLGR
jgi:hypothetical protein